MFDILPHTGIQIAPKTNCLKLYSFQKFNENLSVFYVRCVGPHYWAEMYAGRVACCPLVSDGEYAVGTDGRHTVTLCVLLGAVSLAIALTNRQTN